MFRIVTLAALLALGAGAAVASPAASLAVPDAMSRGGAIAAPALWDAGAAPQDLLREVRWVERCRRVMVERRGRGGRVISVPRQVCRRVWR